MTRKPVVAGRFYAGTKPALIKEIETCAQGITPSPSPVIGAVVPHAGYIYSGRAAAMTIARIKAVETFVIFGPNHTGLGTKASIMSRGDWATPLGNVSIDGLLATEMLDSCNILEEDDLAHMSEHSIEVQLPFLQYYFGHFNLVPVALSLHDVLELEEIGKKTAKAIKQTGIKTCIIASSDMTHYESSESAKKKDALAIKKILALDGKGLSETLNEHNITMCGGAPTIAVLAAARELGAKKAELVIYTNSGEASGDMERVVGYAGIIIT